MSLNHVIGIDLGTTFSVVAACYDGGVEVLQNDSGSRKTPSIVAFTDTEILAGETAAYQAVFNPKNTIYSVKRLIGRYINDKEIEDDIKKWPFNVVQDEGDVKVEIKYKGKTLRQSPEEISSKILEKMKETAERVLNTFITDAVITVPAYFNTGQRETTKAAAQLAGLNVLKIINEPTAAAICYGMNSKKGKPRTVLVYDFGGGTFDVSIIKFHDKDFKVIAVNGDTHLGGENITNRLVDHFIDHFELMETEKSLIQILKKNCEKLKENLSFVDDAKIVIEGTSLEASMTRSNFEKLNEDLFEKTIEFVKAALEDAEMSTEDIDDILLVGGSSRIPRVQELLQELFKDKVLNISRNPDESIAYGAAVLAGNLCGISHLPQRMRGLKLIDVCPISLGVALDDGTMNVLIKRNTEVPCKAEKLFRAAQDTTTELEIVIYEGERFLCEDNKFLGKFELSRITNSANGGGIISITYEIDENGILHVSAIEPTTGIQNSVEITRKNRLNDEDAMKKVIEAEKMKHSDEIQKARIEARNKFEKVVLQIKREANKFTISGKLEEDDKIDVFKECEKLINWIHESQSIPKEEFEKQEIKIEKYWYRIKKENKIV